MVHQADAYLWIHSMKRLGVFLLFPGWVASPSQGYPQAIRRYQFTHHLGERVTVGAAKSKMSSPRTQYTVPGGCSLRSLAVSSSSALKRGAKPRGTACPDDLHFSLPPPMTYFVNPMTGLWIVLSQPITAQVVI